MNPLAKLLAYGALLAALFAGGLGLGAAVGPHNDNPAPSPSEDTVAERHESVGGHGGH